MTLHPVLHRIAQPIAVHEFIDALRAAAPPRFPNYGRRVSGRAGMAISGGVDSMALAFLCAQAHKSIHDVHVADSVAGGFLAMIVDHGLREGSDKEAAAVAQAMLAMGHSCQVWPLKWQGYDTNENLAANIALSEFQIIPGPEPESTIRIHLRGLRQEQGTQGLGQGGGPGQGTGPPASALETHARRLRYRTLGNRLMRQGIMSLLLAHHEDDQYETVLMRLLSGHGTNIRGLRGMRAANDIPECHGMYGVYQSGAVDNKQREYRWPTRVQRKSVRSEFQDDIKLAMKQWRLSGQRWPPTGDLLQQWQWLAQLHDAPNSAAPPLPPLDTEDMGVMTYRPLLAFPKERLIATCTANNVTWFEDKTNADPTMTMRNAVRYVAKHHTLPKALQKPAILQLAARCDAMSRQHDAESRRLIMRHQVVVRFNSSVGTMVVRLPKMEAKARRRPWNKQKDFYSVVSAEKRRLYLRTIAALAVQRLLAFVTPETNVTPISQLQSVVDTLFPDLVDPSSRTATQAAALDPKAFMICNVHFVPFIDNSTLPANPYSSPPAAAADTSSSSPSSSSSPTYSWHMARAPYHSPERTARDVPTIPVLQYYGVPFNRRINKEPTRWKWAVWSPWRLYDGRFWVRMRTRLPNNLFLQPFDIDHSKPFREALGQGLRGPGRLEAFLATLKTYAPGKVRYTLPAIYVLGDISWALDPQHPRHQKYWPEESSLKHYPQPHPSSSSSFSSSPSSSRSGGRLHNDKYNSYLGLSALVPLHTPWELELPDFYTDPTQGEPGVYRNSGFRTIDMHAWERRLRYQDDIARLTRPDPFRPPGQLLALPTLGVHIPGIENWLQWDVRYRKVDTGVLETLAAAAVEKMYLERMYGGEG